MKKAIMITLLTLLLATLGAAVACANEAPPTTTTPTTQPTVITMSYSNFFPPTHLNAILGDEWAKEVESRTDGMVVIDFFPGGTLTAAPQVYDGVVTGISDIGMSVLAYSAGRFPVSELIDLPHKYPNGWVATKVANDFYTNYKPAEFDDVHVLYFHAHGPGVVLTTEKPVRKMEDLKGLVIRSTGVGAKIVQALGGEGYGASQGEAYELMSRGVIGGSLTPREVLKGWNQAEVVKYVTDCTDVGYTANMFVVMNSAKWSALPATAQSAVTAISNEWIEKHGMVWDYYDKVAIDYFLTFEGREVIELPADEMARWVDTAVKPMIDQYITEKSALGLAASDFEEYLLGRVSYWADRAPSADDSVAWVKANLE